MRTFQRIARLIRPSIGLPLLSGLALVGLLILGLGCGQEREPPASATPSMTPRLQDVPVPAGFQFNAGKSGDRLSGGFRVVEHLYEGGATVRRVAEFYRQLMPVHGWTKREESFAGGTQRFAFEKGHDTCYISIYDDWGTKLLIHVYPRGPRSPETETSPKPSP